MADLAKCVKDVNPGGDDAYGYGLRSGIHILLYERSLYWFVRYIHPILISVRSLQKSSPIICGEISLTHLQQLQRQRRLCSLETMRDGYRWSYSQQPSGSGEDFSGYLHWRHSVHTPPDIRRHRSRNVCAVVDEILSFDPAQQTPVQIIEALNLWQERLKPDISLREKRPASS